MALWETAPCNGDWQWLVDSNASDSVFGEPEPNAPEPEYKHGPYEDYHLLEQNYNVEDPAPRPAMPREVFETYE